VLKADGTGGNDVFKGAAGFDAMYGGAGNDTYCVNRAGDKAYQNAGEGQDTVISSVTYSLFGQVVENLTLTGSANLKGTGNSLNNNIVGNPGANILAGGDRNDVLNGKGGKDMLTGGHGSDTFAFDTVAEANGDGITDFWQGEDRIDLSGMDANTVAAGKQPFTFIGAKRFHKVAGELHIYHLREIETPTGGLRSPTPTFRAIRTVTGRPISRSSWRTTSGTVRRSSSPPRTSSSDIIIASGT
jgi:serralysin